MRSTDNTLNSFQVLSLTLVLTIQIIKASLVFFFLDPILKHNHLVFEKLLKKLHKFDEAEFSGFILLEEVVNAFVLFFETGIDHPINLVSSHAASGELFNHVYINGTIVVSIATII